MLPVHKGVEKFMGEDVGQIYIENGQLSALPLSVSGSPALTSPGGGNGCSHQRKRAEARAPPRHTDYKGQTPGLPVGFYAMETFKLSVLTFALSQPFKK